MLKVEGWMLKVEGWMLKVEGWMLKVEPDHLLTCSPCNLQPATC
jgi:hypothetical protein